MIFEAIMKEPVGCLIAALLFAFGCFAIYAMVDVLARWIG